MCFFSLNEQLARTFFLLLLKSSSAVQYIRLSIFYFVENVLATPDRILLLTHSMGKQIIIKRKKNPNFTQTLTRKTKNLNELEQKIIPSDHEIIV